MKQELGVVMRGLPRADAAAIEALSAFGVATVHEATRASRWRRARIGRYCGRCCSNSVATKMT